MIEKKEKSLQVRDGTIDGTDISPPTSLSQPTHLPSISVHTFIHKPSHGALK